MGPINGWVCCHDGRFASETRKPQRGLNLRQHGTQTLHFRRIAVGEGHLWYARAMCIWDDSSSEWTFSTIRALSA